jgi:hypothetical protein
MVRDQAVGADEWHLQPGPQAALKASDMIFLMVRAQRPHCGLQPRQP